MGDDIKNLTLGEQPIWMFEDVTEDLEEDDEAGDPEAGEEGVVDDVEHGDLEPGERSSAEEICKF